MCLGTSQKFGHSVITSASLRATSANFSILNPTLPAWIAATPTSNDDGCQPTTPTSTKDDGNQPNSATEDGNDNRQPIGTTFLFFFFPFTNDLPSSSLAPPRTHDAKHHEDNSAMHIDGHHHPPQMHTISLFLSFFILLTIYFPTACLQHLLTPTLTHTMYHPLPLTCRTVMYCKFFFLSFILLTSIYFLAYSPWGPVCMIPRSMKTTMPGI